MGRFGKNSASALGTAIILAAAFLALSCKSSGGIDILGPADETADAGNLVLDANKDLKQVKILYKKNEGRREELKDAMSSDNEEAVKKTADDIVYQINAGTNFGTSALEKIQKARDMHINPDYEAYLQLKSNSLQNQLDAFHQYREAARSLRDNFDPKNVAQRDKVKADFKARSAKFREIMDEAEKQSKQADELAKEVMQRPRE